MTNPYIEPENYWTGYQDSIDKNKDQKDTMNFARLCFETFKTKEGKEFMNYIDERILMANLIPITTPNFETVNTYYEGFKEAFRVIKLNVKSHEDYISSNKG